MKITLKTLNGRKHSVDIDPNTNIKKIKSYLRNHLKINSTIKLVYKGKILKEEQVLEKIGLKEREFIIVIPQQTRQRKTNKEMQDAIPSTKAKQNRPFIISSRNNVTHGSSTKIPFKNDELNCSIENDSDMSPMMRSTITNLLGMGFEHNEILHALRSSSGNVDLAVDYLLTGISDDLIQQEINETADTSIIDSNPRNYISYSSSNQQENVPNQNQVNTWMNQIMQNPSLLNQILTAIQRTNPQLYIKIVQEMNQNPQVALNLIQQLFMNPTIMTQVLKSLETDSQPTRQVFQLSEEEIKQIVQLEKMGFSRDTVIRAFIVSDRNIEVAASLLFSDMDTFHECLIENSKKKANDK